MPLHRLSLLLLCSGLFANSARADTCADLVALGKSGLPAAMMKETIEDLDLSLTPADLACVVKGGAPSELVGLLGPYVTEAPAAEVSPEEEPKTSDAAPPTEAAPAARPPARAVAARFPPVRPGLEAAPLMLELRRSTPDSGVAVGLGSVIGFGSGQFYAGCLGGGAAAFLADVTGMGLILGAGANGNSDLGIVGAATLAVSRLIQVPAAGVCAKRKQERWLEERVR